MTASWHEVAKLVSKCLIIIKNLTKQEIFVLHFKFAQQSHEQTQQQYPTHFYLFSRLCDLPSPIMSQWYWPSNANSRSRWVADRLSDPWPVRGNQSLSSIHSFPSHPFLSNAANQLDFNQYGLVFLYIFEKQQEQHSKTWKVFSQGIVAAVAESKDTCSSRHERFPRSSTLKMKSILSCRFGSDRKQVYQFEQKQGPHLKGYFRI